MNARKKVLFVVEDNNRSERLGLQILSSIAIEEGYEKDIIILNLNKPEKCLQMARQFQPDVIAYSVMTYEHYSTQKFNRVLKESGLNFISIFGGPHYTFNPEEMLKDEFMDVICIGEGEIPFRQFLKAIKNKHSYLNINNLWVRNNGEIIKNPWNALITNLDSVPFPDRMLIPMDIGEANLLGQKVVYVMVSRGCPNNCSYCFNAKYNELFENRKIRHRSVQNVIEELVILKKEDRCDYIYFADDCFSYFPIDFVKEFVKEYKEKINIPFMVQFRPNVVKDEYVALLKDAGLFFVGIGLECGNEEVSKKVLNRNGIRNDHIINSFKILHKYKIKVLTYNLSILPVENPLKIDWETVKFNSKLKPFHAQFDILLPYPKTQIWNYAIEHKFLNEDTINGNALLPSHFTESSFQFSSKKMVKRCINLHKFSSVAAKYPILIPIIRILILLPNNLLFTYFFFFFHAYHKSIKAFNVKISYKLILDGYRMIRLYLKTH